MAYGAITCVEENLQKLLDDEIYLKPDLVDEVEQLQMDLRFMKTFLERQNGKTSTRFEIEIREVVYNADDAIDVFFTAKKSGLFRLKRPSIFKTLGAFREELRHILDRARNITIAQEPTPTRIPLPRDDTIVRFKFNNEASPVGLGKTILGWNYDELPHHLRDCFLYLGVFPEDAEIPAWKLIRLWIAEGFIQRKPGESLEAVAEENLRDLIARNLVAVEKTKLDGGIKTCRVLNMTREFCISRAAFLEQNLFQEVKASGEGLYKIQKCRRLCIQSDAIHPFLGQKPKGPKVRSLLCFGEEESTNLPPECSESVLEAFKMLRILDVNFMKLPIKLNQLIHLRYISLSREHINSLPEAVSKLRNLKTITIDTSSRRIEIEADIWKLMKLEHLKTKAAIVLNKEGQGKGGENIQTLSRLSVECVTVEFCWRASNIKKLGIRGRLGTLLETNTTCLARLDHLEKLKLVHDVYPETASQDPLIRLPSREAFPPNLMILELSSTFLEWKHMAPLGELPRLEVLKLKENAVVGKVWNAVGGGFHRLEVLLIASTDLELWNAYEDSFPRLRCLVLKNCEGLGEIPCGPVKSLQVLEIERVNKSVVESARRIEKEKQQMQDQPTSGGFKLIIV